MPYTPELDNSACTTLRRLAWAVGEPMSKTMEEIFKFVPLLLDSDKICADCEDTSKCEDCYFNPEHKEGLKSELFTDIVEKDTLQQEFYNTRFTERTKPKKQKEPSMCKTCKQKRKRKK